VALKIAAVGGGCSVRFSLLHRTVFGEGFILTWKQHRDEGTPKSVKKSVIPSEGEIWESSSNYNHK